MVKSRRLFLITIALLGVLLSATVAVAGCGGGTTTTSATTAAATVQSTGTPAGDRALKVLASTPSNGDYANNAVTAATLSQKLNDPAQASQLFLIDIRGKDDFAKGHIKGATQIDFAQWAAPENLSKLPKDKKIVVICYTGNTAAQTTAGLRMLGYDAVVLKEGEMGWAQTSDTQPSINTLNAANNPTVTTPSPSQAAPAPPTATFDKPSDADYSTLAAKANAVMSKMPSSGDYAFNTIGAKVLPTKLADPAQASQLFVVDLRSADDYNKGHIDGAVNIPFTSLAVPDNLKLLPKDKKIVLVCYTGNTAAQAEMILQMLDYDAVVLKFGMMGWNGTGKDSYIQDIQSANNPVVTG